MQRIGKDLMLIDAETDAFIAASEQQLLHRNAPQRH